MEKENPTKYYDFPTSLYSARRLIGINSTFRKFAVCPACHKLYSIQQIKNAKSLPTCENTKYPKHRTAKKRISCAQPLAIEHWLLSGVTFRPRLIFPVPSIREQLATLYNHPGFDNMLQSFLNKNSSEHDLSDIYDGEIWKTFPEQCNLPGCGPFFAQDKLDEHLGLAISLDWFQPFDKSPYSTGVLYAAILNLPREERFKTENMLLLGLLPGPHEV